MRALRPLLAAVALAVVVTGCSRDSSSSLPKPSADFCEAAQRYEKQLVKKPSVDEQITLVGDIARYAPKDIERDADKFLDALRRYADGDRSVVDNPRIQRVIENVNRRAADGCEFYKREPGGGI